MDASTPTSSDGQGTRSALSVDQNARAAALAEARQALRGGIGIGPHVPNPYELIAVADWIITGVDRTALDDEDDVDQFHPGGVVSEEGK